RIETSRRSPEVNRNLPPLRGWLVNEAHKFTALADRNRNAGVAPDRRRISSVPASGALAYEQAFAKAKVEFSTSALRLQSCLHLGRYLSQHRAQQCLHDGVVTRGPALEFHRLVDLLFVRCLEAGPVKRTSPFLHGP